MRQLIIPEIFSKLMFPPKPKFFNLVLMSNRVIRERNLRHILKDNFSAGRLCRKMKETVQDPALSNYFESLASKRFQLAFEITEEISLYGGEKPYFSFVSQDKGSLLSLQDDYSCVKKIFKVYRKTLERYKEVLSQVNDGSCREVIMRHKAYFENKLFELKGLKSLLKYRKELENDTQKQLENN